MLYFMIGEIGMTLYVTNAPIIPLPQGANMIIRAREITLEQAKDLVKSHYMNGTLQSAVGHQATADLLTRVLGITIPMNRVEIYLGLYDSILAFSLNRRLREGEVITDISKLEEIGFRFILYEAIMDDYRFEKMTQTLGELAQCIRDGLPVCDEDFYDHLSYQAHDFFEP